jgi:hypothetical protein
VDKSLYPVLTCLLIFGWDLPLVCRTPVDTETRHAVCRLHGFTGIRGRVFDAESGVRVPARVVVRDSAGGLRNSYYKSLPGFFTEEDGSFELSLEPGHYTVDVHHGIDYISRTDTVRIASDAGVDADFPLSPWVPLRRLGWVNGDGHAHLYTDTREDTVMLRDVRRICLAQGVDFLCANQGWAGYTDSTWRKGYDRWSDGRFVLYYGAEMPKYRTGHTWWLGLQSTCGVFDDAMDSTYENRYYQSFTKKEWTFADLPFPNVPDVELVARFRKAQDAVAVVPHPCSWWMQERGGISKYTSNVAVSLAFGLLAGNVWDGLVVMGYDADHLFYQNLWFHVLNQGVRMPAISELDGGYGQDNRFPYGLFRTYFFTEGKTDPNSVKHAVRKGRTFVTSGPVVFAEIDGKYRIGDTVPPGRGTRVLTIDAYASGDRFDRLSYIAVFRNSRLFKYWDLRNLRQRRFRTELALCETEKAWYVCKAYGGRTWSDPSNLDVVSVCKSIEDGTFDGGGGERDVCITSPIYFSTDTILADRFQSHVSLALVDPSSGKRVHRGKVHVIATGEKVQTIQFTEGFAEFPMPVQSVLRIEAEGYPVLHRCLFFDYPLLCRKTEELANGDWRKKKAWDGRFQPGQVPWEAFGFEETKRMVSKVKWTIPLCANERENAWDRVEKILANCR